MKYKLEYVNENSFIKEYANNAPIQTIDEKGRSKPTGNYYKKSNVPKSRVLYTPKFDERTGMQIALGQTELNNLVAKLNVFDKDGNQIVTAPLGTCNHPFWKSDQVNFIIENGRMDIDDELPKDRLLVAALRADSTVYVKEPGNSKPKSKGHHIWVLTQKNDENDDYSEIEPTLKAVEQFYKLKHDEVVKILKGLGIRINEKTDPELLRKRLFKCITDDKDLKYGGYTYLQKFLLMCNTTSEEKDLIALAHDAMKLFEKKSNNKNYFYGAVKLGRNIEEIVETMKNNFDLTEDILKDLKTVNEK